MAWPIDLTRGPFANTTLIGVGQEFVPHAIIETLPDGQLKAYGIEASIICNATWAMGIKLQIMETSDGTYGFMSPDGQFLGALRDLMERRADLTFTPIARMHPHDDFFGKSPSLDTVKVAMLSGMRQAFQKSSTSVVNEELLTEVLPVLIVSAFVSIVLSSVFTSITKGGSCTSYSNLFFMFYYPTLFYEASHAQMLSNHRIPYSSKILFGSWLLATFVIGVFIQSTLKSSFVVLVETERIRNNKDVLDRPTLLPIMSDDLIHVLTAIKMDYGDQIIAQRERLKPESAVALKDYYSLNTIEKVLSRRGVIYADEFGAIYELPRICPQIKGSYLYQSDGMTAMTPAFYYRPGIDPFLVREINKRLRWLLEANIPWMPRYIMDPTNSPCFVKSYEGQAVGGGEATQLSEEDLHGLWVVLGFGGLIASLVFIGELLCSKIVVPALKSCNKKCD